MGKHIAVIGAGAVGGYVGGRLALAGEDVSVVDPWPAHVEAMRGRGLQLHGAEGEETVRMNALHLTEAQAFARKPVDIAIISTKSYDTVWAATLICVVATDLLTGVLVGMGLSLLELLPHARRLRLSVNEESREEAHEVALHGTATFLNLPKLSARLEALPAGRLVILNVERLSHIDHTCAEMVREWVDRRRGAGAQVELFGATGRMRHLAA